MFCPICATTNFGASDRCRGCGGPLIRVCAAASPGRHRLASRWRRLGLEALPLLLAIGLLAGFYQNEQANRAAWYARAETALAAGEFDTALNAFSVAGNFADAPARSAALSSALTPARAAYRQAAAELARGETEAAIATLRPFVHELPTFGDAAALLASARRQRAAELAREAEAAGSRHDWLAAERALVALTLVDPGDPEAATRLTALRRDHVPFAFAREQALYLMSPDGADERLVTDSVLANRPVWSPDRTRLAFVSPHPDDREAPGLLYVIDADGFGLTKLSESAHRNALPAWSPDGQRIAYTSVATWDALQNRGLFTVHVVDVMTGYDKDVTSVTARHAMTPSWSPTGDQLAFISRGLAANPSQPVTNGPGDVSVLTIATGEIQDLTMGTAPDVVRVSWSPLPDRLLCYAYDQRTGAGTAGGGVRLYEIDLPDGGLHLIAENIEAPTEAWSPAWSPDGGRLAWVDGAEVVVRGGDGEEARMTIETYLSGGLTWSPDGRALLAVAADPNQSSLIVDFGAAKPTVTPLKIAYDTIWPTGMPQWSPPIPAVPPAFPATIGGTGLDREGSELAGSP